MSNVFYVTTKGLEAERNALAHGAKVKITNILVDETNRPDSTDFVNITAVNTPYDQNGKLASYPVSGESQNGKLLVGWTLPANSGDYNCYGIAFMLENGVLWGYQKLSVGNKPNPDKGGAFFEPKGWIQHITSSASAITCELSLDSHYPTTDQVILLLREESLRLRKLMRRHEGKLGKVRLFMANDVDEDYLPIRGQTLQKADYPDYFAHMGVTSSTLRLPDWSLNGYVRQFSDSLEAGEVLAQQFQSHGHGTESKAAGGVIPEAYPLNIGTKSGTVTMNGRFYSNTDKHAHHKGSMNIYGSFRGDDRITMMPIDGAFTAQRVNSGGGAQGGDSWHTKVHFNANRNWSGVTSYDSHNHYTDVNFGTKTVSINIGSHTVRMKQLPNHTHETKVLASGGEETRPNTTVGVYAVKVKYITPIV